MVNSTEYINDTSRDYSIYTCESRAIPKATDGLKDAQRKALWLIRNRADKIKTVSLAGEMISSGLYHHGDKPAADAISGLAAPYLNNINLLEGKGTFGSRVNPKAIGAPRYTYVKRSKVAQLILYKDLDIVPLVENYDGSTLEPLHFLPIIPIGLLNGISGIAVGYSTEILPHSLNDLIDACKDALKGKKIKQLTPNYSQFNMQINHIENNAWEFRGRIDRVDSSSIRVLDLPIDLTLEKFKKRLDDLEDSNQIKSYEDQTTDRINIRIKFSRGQIKDWSDEKIINFLKLKSRKSQRITVIGWDNNGVIQYDTPEELVLDFVNWRIKWYYTRYQKLLDDTKKALPYYQAIEECFENQILEIIKLCESKKEALQSVEVITSKFNLDNDQISKIANIPLYRWNSEDRQDNLEKIKQLKDDIITYQNILNDEQQIKDIYLEELDELKKAKLS